MFSRQPLEVKKRIGYLPETPPLYPEMETAEYLKFVGKLKGLSGADLQKRVDYVSERCAVTDVRKKLLGKLSKGYRQRVGLAQAIIHNPDVLILDEPTSGLDPKQINETRDLIKSLAGDHTIILSTHILSEVEQTCEQVIIINKGKLVATDSVRNLQARLAEPSPCWWKWRVATGALEDLNRAAAAGTGVRGQPGLVQAAGRQPGNFRSGKPERDAVRGDLARAVVESGWDLNELRPSAMSLEEIFLQLTGSEPGPEVEQPAEVSQA